MQQYLMPLTSQTETLGGQTSTVTAPKYMSLFAGASSTKRSKSRSRFGLVMAVVMAVELGIRGNPTL